MGKIQKCEKCGVVHYTKRHTCEKKGKIDSKWLVRGKPQTRSLGDMFGSK